MAMPSTLPGAAVGGTVTSKRAAGKNMAAHEAVRLWVSGGLRMPWVEAWTYLYLALGIAVYVFSCPLDRAVSSTHA